MIGDGMIGENLDWCSLGNDRGSGGFLQSNRWRCGCKPVGVSPIS